MLSFKSETKSNIFFVAVLYRYLQIYLQVLHNVILCIILWYYMHLIVLNVGLSRRMN
jgi:hypothetical protein